MQTTTAEPPGNDTLQFERAEFSSDIKTISTCEKCTSTLLHVYYDINGLAACESCKHNIEKSQESGGSMRRFARALAFGLPAAGVGSCIYYAIAAWTGYEFGLVAVIIGLMVGGAVRVESSRRGGWVYQTLAMFLTYLAIASTYMSFAIQGFMQAAEQQGAQQLVSPADTTDPPTVQDASTTSDTNQKPAASQPSIQSLTATDIATQSSTQIPTSISIAIGLVALLALTLALPFLAGFQNIMGIVIIGIGLYEAWQLNKRETFQISGPFEIGAKRT